MNTILQVPIDKKIRNKATSKATEMGFSSLQEVVRLFVNRVAAGEVNFKFEDSIQLSPMAIKRYNKIIDNIESGKEDVKSFDSVDDMMKELMQ